MDECGASKYQGLVGLPIALINVDAIPNEHKRVILHGEVMTKDLILERINIFVGEDGNITDISCG